MAESDQSASSIVRFGIFELDLRSGELTKGGRRQSLPEQPFRVLALLLERPGELVTRDDLRRHLWPADTFVDFEHGLNAAVKRLRDALGDSAETPRFIETIPRRGYRFIATLANGAGPAGASLTASTVGDAASTSIAPASGTLFHALRSLLTHHRSASAVTLGALAAAAATTLWWKMPTQRAAPAGADGSPAHNLTRVTFGPGFDTDPSWSPDGRFIAYASNRSGNYDIWVQALAGGEPRQLTRSPAADTKPAWSPDGSGMIVFRSERDGAGLYVVPAGGGPERPLTTFGTQPKWAPDGSQVLFASSDLSSRPRFYVVRLDGSPPSQVLGPFMDNVDGLLGWNWYPDSQKVTLLAHHNQRNWGLVTVPLSGHPIVPDEAIGRANNARMLTFCQCPGWAGERRLFEWSSSGADIYVQCAHDLTMDLWRFGVDPRTFKVQNSERLTAGTGQTLPLAVSPDNRRVAYTARTMRIRLWAFPFDAATGRITGRGEPVTEPTVYAWESDLSPDGSRIAFRGSREGTTKDELWATDLDAGTRRPIAVDDQSRGVPHWSRDGRYMAYQWSRRAPNSNGEEVAVVVSRADGTDERPITVPRLQDARGVPWFEISGWAADDTRVLGSSERGITSWSVETGPRVKDPRVLASSPNFALWQARSSPDGRWVSFVALSKSDPSTNIVEVIPATANALREDAWLPITDQGEWADKPRWSPDGKMLYLMLRRDGFWNLWAVRFDSVRGKATGAPFQVTHFTNPELEVSRNVSSAEVGISPTRLLLTMMERTGSIWTVDTDR